MCLSDIGRVVAVDAARHAATVDLGGRSIDVSTIALGLDAPLVVVGDWLVVHTGLAVEQLTDDEAHAVRVARERFDAHPTEGGDST